MASTKRSSSASDSDSVGSTISVPATGKLMVGRVEAEVDEPLGDVVDGDAGGLGDRPQVEDALVGDAVVVARVEHRVGGVEPGGDVVGVEDGQLGGPA